MTDPLWCSAEPGSSCAIMTRPAGPPNQSGDCICPGFARRPPATRRSTGSPGWREVGTLERNHPAVAGGTRLEKPSYLLHRGDALDAYPGWPAPTAIISDGAYGVRGFPGDATGAGSTRRLVPAARRGVEPADGGGHDAVVLEHRGRLGHRASAAGRARLGVRAGHHLGQGDQTRRRQRQRPDDPQVSHRHRDLRLLPAAARDPGSGRAHAGATVGASRMAAVRAAAGPGQRRVRRDATRRPGNTSPRTGGGTGRPER